MRVTIKGLPGLDGEYDTVLAEQPLTNREMRMIRKISGVRGGEVIEAIRSSDNDFFIALAVITLARFGKPPEAVEEMLLDAPIGTSQVDMSYGEPEAESDARPPESPTVSGDENLPEESGDGSVSTPSSGNGSEQLSDPNPPSPSPTGHLPSGM